MILATVVEAWALKGHGFSRAGGSPGISGAPNERRFCGRWGGFMPGSEAFRLREKGSMNE